MKTTLMTLTLLLTLIPLTPFNTLADSPCKDKREAKSEANKAFTECLKKWHAGMKPDAADPSEDCVAKFQAVQVATKNIKVCRAAALATKDKKAE